MTKRAAANFAHSAERSAGDAPPPKSRRRKRSAPAAPPQARSATAGGSAIAVSPRRPSRRVLYVALGLVVGVFAVFGPALRYPFITYDTQNFVIDNTALHGGLSLAGVRWAFTTIHGGYWMPLTWLSHMLDCQLYGLHPWGHILSSVLLHAANAVLLLVALWRLTGGFWRSALVAAIFAFHPQRVESVVWVAERKDVLSALFWILTLLAYNHYARGAFAWRRYGLVLLTLALGLLAKPSVVTLPCLLLLLDFWPLRRWRPAGKAMRTDAPPARPATLAVLLLEKAPMMALAVAIAAATYRAQAANNVVYPLPLAMRLAHVPLHYCMYLAKTFWPAALAIYYPVGTRFPSLLKLVPAAALLGAATLGAALAWRRRPYLTVGWCWFLGILVPMIGIVQVFSASIADRYTYLSQIGLAIICAWGLGEIGKQEMRNAECGMRNTEDRETGRQGDKVTGWGIRNPQSAIALGVLALLMLRAGFQVTWWRDDLTLWRHVIALDPTAHFAWHNLGVAYSAAHDERSALKAELEALRLDPSWPQYHRNIALTYGALGEVGEAVREFKSAIEHNPADVKSRLDLAWALVQLGRLDEAARQLNDAMLIEPGNALAYAYMGSIWATRGDLPRAAAFYAQALERDPRNYQGNYYLGVLALDRRDYAAARAHLEATVRFYPKDANARFQLGRACAAQGDRAQAAACYQAALELARAAGDQALAGQIQAAMR